MNAPSKKPVAGPTVEQVIQARQEEFHSRNIAQRINAAMAEVDYIQKEKKQGMNYSIVSHDAVTAKVRPILQLHGVVYYPRDLNVQQNGNRTEAVFVVRFENIDDRTDFIDVSTMGFGVDPQDKGPGKAISYGVKYALLKVLGLETGDDPDEVQDTRADHRPRQGEEQPANGPIPRTKLEGQHSSKTALRGAVNAIINGVRKAGSGEEISDILKRNRETIEQAERDWPELITGDHRIEGDEGLKGFVRKRREALAGSLTYQLLVSTLQECANLVQLRAWMREHGDKIGSLDGEESTAFESLYDTTEATLAKLETASA